MAARADPYVAAIVGDASWDSPTEETAAPAAAASLATTKADSSVKKQIDKINAGKKPSFIVKALLMRKAENTHRGFVAPDVELEDY